MTPTEALPAPGLEISRRGLEQPTAPRGLWTVVRRAERATAPDDPHGPYCYRTRSTTFESARPSAKQAIQEVQQDVHWRANSRGWTQVPRDGIQVLRDGFR